MQTMIELAAKTMWMMVMLVAIISTTSEGAGVANIVFSGETCAYLNTSTATDYFEPSTNNGFLPTIQLLAIDTSTNNDAVCLRVTNVGYVSVVCSADGSEYSLSVFGSPIQTDAFGTLGFCLGTPLINVTGTSGQCASSTSFARGMIVDCTASLSHPQTVSGIADVAIVYPPLTSNSVSLGCPTSASISGTSSPYDFYENVDTNNVAAAYGMNYGACMGGNAIWGAFYVKCASDGSYTVSMTYGHNCGAAPTSTSASVATNSNGCAELVEPGFGNQTVYVKVDCSGSTAATVQGDPRFVGPRGQRYTVTGTPNSLYNLVSDKLLQYNARFVSYGRTSIVKHDAPNNHHNKNNHTHSKQHVANVTFIGEVALKFIDSRAREHRFHVNIFHHRLQRFTTDLLRATLGEHNESGVELLHDLSLNYSSLANLIQFSQQYFHLDFDGTRVPLDIELLPPSNSSTPSSLPVQFRSSFELQSCAAKTGNDDDDDDDDSGNTNERRCHVRVHGGTNLISVGGPDLPAVFWFAVVVSQHGEIYLNEKHEFHHGATRFTSHVHGLLGFTFRTKSNDDTLPRPIESGDSAQSLQLRTSHHYHDKNSREHLEWELGDAARFLEGELADYSPSGVWSDNFTFNQFQTSSRVTID